MPLQDRIKIETDLPIGKPLGAALAEARLAACEAMGIHCVEQQVQPKEALVRSIITEGPDAGKTAEVPSPNDATVARTLISWWSPIL